MRVNEGLKKKIFSMLLIILTGGMVGYVTYFTMVEDAVLRYEIHNGQLDLSGLDLHSAKAPVAIAGEWSIYPGRLLEPSQLRQERTGQTVAIGDRLPAEGTAGFDFATLHMQITVAEQAPRTLFLKVPKVFNISEAWAGNEKIVDASERRISGLSGESSAGTMIKSFAREGERIDLVLWMQNDMPNKSVAAGYIELGSSDVILDQTVSHWLLLSVLLGGILFIGLFNIIIFYVRNDLKIHYYFGLLCVFNFIWHVCNVVEFDLSPFSFLDERLKVIVSTMSSNRMMLYFLLYTMHILDIHKPKYEKGLKAAANLLLIACFFMPFSEHYSALIIRTIAVFSACASLYLCYDVVKLAGKYRKDIRIVNVIAYVMSCSHAVMELIGVANFYSKTMPVAFIMIASQALVLALRYSAALTEVERANETLENTVALRTAELVQKEEETTHLITSISHDLRTPIAVLGGYMELLHSDPEINETNRQYINHSLSRLSQMEKLTLDLFTLSQISDKSYVFQLETVNMKVVISHIADLYASRAEQKGITLRIEAEQTVCIADPIRVMQVLDNLMMNALSFARSAIAISAFTSGGYVVVSVTDDGPGIPEADIPFLFNRFYKKRKDGFGLGLSNVKELVIRMHGEVSVDSIPNARTSFTFTLPASRSHREVTP